jgi:hypothetical protein
MKITAAQAQTEIAQAVEAVNALQSQALDTEHQSTEKIKSMFGEGGDTRQQLDTLRKVVLNLSDRVTAIEAKK